MSRNTLLIRDRSKLSEEVENYLKENKIGYDVIFSEDDNLPYIMPPSGISPYKGERGFKLYKTIYKNL
jgi:hypothetical protein